MLNEKINPKLAIASVATGLLAAGAVFLLLPGKLTTPSAPKPAIKADTLKPVPKPVVKPHPAPIREADLTEPEPKKKVDRDDENPPPTKREKVQEIKRIESKLLLKKPQGPSQIGEYLPLVYWAARQIGRLGERDRALQWVEEGLSFSQDASFFAYGAFLDYRQGRKTIAQSKAEQALAAPAYLDTRAQLLAQAVLVLTHNPKDSAANSLVSSYE